MARGTVPCCVCIAVLAIAGLAGCGGGSSTPPPQNPAVSISPKRAAVVATSQSQQFTGTVTGNVSDLSVTWSVDGVPGGTAAAGMVSSSGLYAPPATAGTHTVTATSVAAPSASATASVAVTDLAGVFTYHNNLSRDGSNVQEYGLTASSVTPTTFGKLFSCAVDGAVYTQPLWVPGLSVGGGTHNVIFVATQHDSLYAFDADQNPCVKLWKVNLLDTLHGGTSGETPIIWNDVGNCFGDIYPEVGVTGSPVIDPATSTIYLVSSSEVGNAGGNCSYNPGTFHRRLHALDLATGNEKFSGPVTIVAAVPGLGDGSSSGMVSLDPQKHHQRSGLALSGGTVYVAWAAHEDASPYHGWLLAYDASNLQQTGVFNTTPNGGLGGIWGGGGAPAIDSGGDIYVSTGNGVFDANSTTVPFNDYGDSVLRIRPFTGATLNGVNLNLVDWFTPDDQQFLSSVDADLGSGAAILLPDQTIGPAHLLIEVGKEGVVYLIDRDNMGFFHPNDNNQIVQSFAGTGGGFWGTPAFWQNGLYFAGAGDNLRQFSFDPTTGLFNPNTPSQSNQVYGFPDASPSISSQGASNGIVWAIEAGLYGYASPNAGGTNCYQAPVPPACTGPAILHAYNAGNLAVEYWNSSMAANQRDQAGNAVKFVAPTIANGKVYLSTRTEIDVYGLLPN
jgi:hypothetical protein